MAEDGGRLFRQLLDADLDVRAAGAEAEDADAAEHAVADRTAGQHDLAARRDARQQQAGGGVLAGDRGAGPAEVKREERQLRRRVEDDARNLRDRFGGVNRECALLGDRRLDAGGAV